MQYIKGTLLLQKSSLEEKTLVENSIDVQATSGTPTGIPVEQEVQYGDTVDLELTIGQNWVFFPANGDWCYFEIKLYHLFWVYKTDSNDSNVTDRIAETATSVTTRQGLFLLCKWGNVETLECHNFLLPLPSKDEITLESGESS